MPKEENTFECCLCHRHFRGFGNNPWGAVYKDEHDKIVMPEFKEDDRCCDECDGLYVIPGRMYRMALKRKKEKDEAEK